MHLVILIQLICNNPVSSNINPVNSNNIVNSNNSANNNNLINNNKDNNNTVNKY